VSRAEIATYSPSQALPIHTPYPSFCMPLFVWCVFLFICCVCVCNNLRSSSLHDIFIANIVWCTAYTKGVRVGVCMVRIGRVIALQ